MGCVPDLDRVGSEPVFCNVSSGFDGGMWVNADFAEIFHSFVYSSTWAATRKSSAVSQISSRGGDVVTGPEGGWGCCRLDMPEKLPVAVVTTDDETTRRGYRDSGRQCTGLGREGFFHAQNGKRGAGCQPACLGVLRSGRIAAAACAARFS